MRRETKVARYRGKGENTTMNRRTCLLSLLFCLNIFSLPVAHSFKQNIRFRSLSHWNKNNLRTNIFLKDATSSFDSINRHRKKVRQKEQNNYSSKRIQKRKDGLNSEIFWLRKQKNGCDRAESRLQEGIASMHDNADAVVDLVRTNDKKKLLLYPDEVSFNAILSSYAKNIRWDRNAAAKAARLLSQMEEEAQIFPHLKPTIFSFNAVLEAYAKDCRSCDSNKSKACKDKVLHLFRKIQNSPDLEPNTFTRNLILTSETVSSPEWKSCEEWALNFLSEESKDTSNIPDRNTYNQLFQSYARLGYAGKAESLLQQLIAFDASKLGTDIKPTVVWFNLVLKALAANGGMEYDAPLRAENILRKMYALHKSGFDLHPDTSTYNHVLNVLTTPGDTNVAERLVQELELAFLTSSTDGIVLQPDQVTYATLLKVYSTKQKLEGGKSTQLAYDIAVNATKVFDRMDSLTNAGWKGLTPNRVIYNTLISIWANVGTREALHTAATIFQRMCEDSENGPDSITYTTLIHGWSRGVRHLARVPEAGYRAEQLLQQLEQLPSNLQQKSFSPSKVYNSVITAWSRSGENVAADKVEALLARLEKMYCTGVKNAKPNKTTFLCMIGAYAKSRIVDAESRCDALLDKMEFYRKNLGLDELYPDRAIYNAILNALAKSQQASAVEKAESILNMMQNSPNLNLRPDIVTYATIIDCHTKCGGSSSRAEELLDFVETAYQKGEKGLEPNAVFYSAILQAWAKSASTKGAQNAEDLLRRNMKLFREGHAYAKPHAILYNAVMDAIARSGGERAGERAEDLLKEMEFLYQAGDIDLKPSRRSFNAVILANRNAGDGGQKAEEILWRMEEMAKSGRPELTPDVVSYNCAISAIVHSDAENKGSDGNIVADRAQALLDRMEERHVQPDGRTYSPVIEAWLKRNDEKGQALAEAMIQQFLTKVETKKKRKKPGNDQNLYEDAVWTVIKAYRSTD